MPNRAPFLNANVVLGEEVWLVELQHIHARVSNGVRYQSVSHFEEYGEEFYSYEDALDHLNFEIEHDQTVHAARIKRKLVQTTELVVFDYDREGL